MEVIPAVDILDGSVVRLRKGDFADVTTFGDDPVAAVAGWAAEGASMVHVVDLAGARDGRPDREMWRAVASAGVPVQVGGGLRTVEDVAGAIEAGIARAVVGTAAVWSQEVLAAMVDVVGAGSVVVALDVKDGRARGRGWLDEGRPMDDVLAEVVASGVHRALVTGIERDGVLTGPDRRLLDDAADSGLAVIASGGVASLRHLEDLADGGFEAAIVGRALYDGAFTYREAAEAASRNRD